MAALRSKVQKALDETRILVLGAQVLLGMQFRAVFEDRFAGLPRPLQLACVAGLVLMVVALALLLSPATFHHLSERGEDTPELLAFIARAMRPALVPFVLVLGIDVLVAGTVIAGGVVATVLASALVAVAGGYLFMLEIKGERGRRPEEAPEGPTPLGSKIRHVLTESRVVLPGAQALLGFQFIVILTRRFADLPASARGIHLASLLCVAVTTMLLMAPAAYHRIVAHGEETEAFQRFASRIVLGALVPLGLGVAGDLYVVSRLVTGSAVFSAVLAVVMLLGTFGLWFGLTLFRRQREERPA